MTSDLWFDYVATCTGIVTIDTCSSGASPDTNLIVYDGCLDCPPTLKDPMECNGDNEDICGTESMASAVRFDGTEGRCYKIRLTGEAGSQPSGELRITCGSGCPPGHVEFLDPPTGTHDARRPHEPGSPHVLLGIDRVVATGPAGAEPSCWELCETVSDFGDNFVADVVEDPPGSYTIMLDRPITPGAFTSISYTGAIELQTETYCSLPGDVHFTRIVDEVDVQQLRVRLQDPTNPQWSEYITDCDHSGEFTPLDLLCLMDILVGDDGWWGRGMTEPTQNCPE
jgi:hypothetical protein